MHVHIFHMPIAMHMSDFGEMPICLISIYGWVTDALDDMSVLRRQTNIILHYRTS